MILSDEQIYILFSAINKIQCSSELSVLCLRATWSICERQQLILPSHHHSTARQQRERESEKADLTLCLLPLLGRELEFTPQLESRFTKMKNAYHVFMKEITELLGYCISAAECCLRWSGCCDVRGNEERTYIAVKARSIQCINGKIVSS